MEKKIFCAKCFKDGRQVSGIFALIQDEKGNPVVVIGKTASIGRGQAVYQTLPVKPEMIQPVRNPEYDFEYLDVIIIRRSNRN